MVAKKKYIPERGDIVWVSLNPTRGHEQRGRRPALVLSPRSYNAAAGLVLACPITSQVKGYPFEVKSTLRKIAGVVLVDQVRSLDWKERAVEKIATAPASTLEEVQELVKKLLF